MLFGPAARAADSQPQVFSGVPDRAGFRGGLIVHLGCGDGRSTGQLAASGNRLVHGLDTDVAEVQAARTHLHQSGLYGRVAVDTFDGRQLPYADNLVNLLVVSGPSSVDRAELLRVLCPGGTAVFTTDDGRQTTDKMIKPRPANIDQWTHFLYDASGNPVAHDEVVGPPGRVQWIAGPRTMRSHEHVPGIYCIVSAGGRIFYIEDAAETGALRAPPEWQLVARDAFNGTLLWKRPIAQWFPHFVGWGSTPRQLLSRSAIYSPDSETGRQPQQYDANAMPGSRSDLLSSDAQHVYLQESVFDGRQLVRHDGNAHLFATTGMLDDAWSHRSYWIFGTKSSMATGCSGRARDLVYGRLLVFDERTVYGYGRSSVHWSSQLEDGPYRLFAVPRAEGGPAWRVTVGVRVRAMLGAGELLFIAGSPAADGEQSGVPRDSDTGLLLAVSTTDGSIRSQVPLASPPVFDGLAAAEGKLFLAQESGHVVCLEGR